MAAEKPLNIGIVGTGIFATDNHLPNIQHLDKQFQVVAVANRTISKAEVFAEKAKVSDKSKVYSNYEDLINDDSVDVIDALLPVEYNYGIIEAAVKAGKPICIEKPIANNLENAHKIVDLSRSTDVPIAILENWLFKAALKVVKPLMSQIGEVAGFNYTATGPFDAKRKYIDTPWRAHPKHIGGYLSDGGVHQLAFLVDVLGEVDTVSAYTKQLQKESGADDILFSSMKLKSGGIGTFTYGSAFGPVEKRGLFVIYGTKGSIFYNFSPSDFKPYVIFNNGKEEKKIFVEFPDESDGLIQEFENFHEAVVKNDKKLIRGTPEIAFHHLAIIDAALKSSKNDGSSVKVEGY